MPRARPPNWSAKHKLLYPLLAVYDDVRPAVSKVIPVFLRAGTEEQRVTYDIYECEPLVTDDRPPCLDQIEVADQSHYAVALE